MDAPGKVASGCLAARVRRLSRVVTNLYDEALRPFGLRVSQMNVLAAAAIQNAARPADLCRALELDPSTLSRNLQVLRRQGWIEFLEDSGDARAQPFRVTVRGRELIDRAHPAWSLAQQRAEQLLGPEIVEALAAAAPADGLSRSTSTPAPATVRSSPPRSGTPPH